MKQYIAILLASCAIITGCKTEEIHTFDTSTHYIHFEKKSTEATRFSFATKPGESEYNMRIPLTLIGTALTEDMTYTVSVITEGEMASTISSENFELPARPVFRKELYTDTLVVKLKDSEALKEEKVLRIKLSADNNFNLGPIEYTMAEIYVSNSISQPDWWDQNMTNNFLGEYSDIKYGHFINATGVTDLSEKSVTYIQAVVSQFVNYLIRLDNEGKTAYESDGVTKVLDTVVFGRN